LSLYILFELLILCCNRGLGFRVLHMNLAYERETLIYGFHSDLASRHFHCWSGWILARFMIFLHVFLLYVWWHMNKLDYDAAVYCLMQDCFTHIYEWDSLFRMDLCNPLEVSQQVRLPILPEEYSKVLLDLASWNFQVQEGEHKLSSLISLHCSVTIWTWNIRLEILHLRQFCCRCSITLMKVSWNSLLDMFLDDRAI